MTEKRLGRPKAKNKPEGAEWLFHEKMSADDKRKMELVRLSYRCQLYDVEKHGPTPTALPKVTNKMLLHYLVTDSYYLLYGGDMPPRDLERNLRFKGCINADELLGIEEGHEE